MMTATPAHTACDSMKLKPQPAFGTGHAARIALAGLCLLALAGRAQSISYVVDQFNPAGADGFSYSAGQIGDVWFNWFGSGFQSLAWDATSDASNNPNSGSLKINANFTAAGNQFEVYDGLAGINPALNGLLYTNFQCDVRFAGGSATVTNGSDVTFGHLQFGVITAGDGQDYFGGIDVPASNTNWVHVSLPISAITDTNLIEIGDVLIHIYAPYYGSGATLSGASTLWVDNIQFTGPPLATSGQCTVDWSAVFQRIDGFGASSAWLGTWNAAEADVFFSTNNGILYTNYTGGITTNNGIGLSLLRNHIAYASSTSATALPTTVETNIMIMAQARGARVWSTPWTPATGFKSNKNANGGSYLGSGNNATNLAYASQLANYVASMKNNFGINLYAISIQNEPDANVTTYEACYWNSQQIHDFATNLYNALVAANVAATKIMLPESQNWQDYSNLAVKAMSDSASNCVGIIADHNYDGNYGPASLVKNSYGKALWETEVAILSGSDSSITNGVYYAGRIHDFLTIAHVNAWHYWWLIAGGTDSNEGLMDLNATPTKRMFALGQFSRFVRPNFYRLGVTNSGPLLVSAYKDSLSPNFAVVAINSSAVTVTQAFNLTNLTAVSSVIPWLTTSNLSLAAQPPVSVTNLNFTYALPALSIATFVGQATTNPPPVFAAVANQTINPDSTLVLTDSATDGALPPPTLTYTLLAAPTNAAVNAASGVITWRPLLSQANTTNSISVQVSDNGTPALTATNSFSVTVNPVTPPTVAAQLSAGVVSLTVNGVPGPNYSLLVSSNLTTWQVLFTTNSPLLPLSLAQSNAAPAMFYRIQIGP
jgi:glucuronoarabinoxylan endo-1,4-beta-xylanase